MSKIITIKTDDREIAIRLKEDLTNILSDHVNCIWDDGRWCVEANAEEAEVNEIRLMIDQCENYTEGKFNYTIEDE